MLYFYSYQSHRYQELPDETPCRVDGKIFELKEAEISSDLEAFIGSGWYKGHRAEPPKEIRLEVRLVGWGDESEAKELLEDCLHRHNYGVDLERSVDALQETFLQIQVAPKK